MNKCICDICKTNEADKNFRVKGGSFLTGSSWFIKYEWKDIDICEKCYKKFLMIKADKKIEDMIVDLIGTTGWSTKFEKESEQVAYLTGFQDILDMLYKNRIIKEKIEV